MAINAFVPDDYVGQIERGRAMFNRNKMAPLERQSQRLANERNAFVNQNMAQDREFGLQDRQRNVALSQFEVMQAINDDMARLPNAEARAHMWNTQGKWAFDNNLISEWKPAGPEAFGDEMFPQSTSNAWGRDLVPVEFEDGSTGYVQAGQEGVRRIPGIRPPGPSPRDIAQTRKAEADATAAEFAAQTAEQTAIGAQQTQEELQSLAGELLSIEPDAVRAVYGSVQGMLPSLRQDTVDAEAKIDRLIDLLTLENTKKMTGVLSESDIKILQRAGTELANKRISDEMALKELERIAGVLQKTRTAPPPPPGFTESVE